MCLVEDGTPSDEQGTSDSAVRQLVASYDTKRAVASTAINHAERVQEMNASAFQVNAGSDANSTVAYFEAAALAGQTRGSAVSVEVMSMSAQVGIENEATATLFHVSGGASSAQASLDAFKAEAHIGFSNADGSTGFNAGASLTAMGAEVQESDGANSVNLGLSIGIGAELALGTRDADNDQRSEYCARVAAGPFALGTCFEPGGWLDAVR